MIALVLQDEAGIWYRDSSGLAPEQMAALEQALAQGSAHEFRIDPRQGQALQVVETLPLKDVYHRVIGTLCVASPSSLMLSTDHREGLGRVVEHIQAVLSDGRQQLETRATPRSPSATSFVPGLVHELGSFIFGISANLDAFEARFAGLEDVSKYGTTIRRSLDRMSAFIEELREYGDPQRLSWSRCELDPLLKDAVENHRSLAAKNKVDLQLHLEGALPPLNADEHSLRAAFSRIVGFVLQHEEPGGRVALHVGTRLQGERLVICGHLDGSNLKLKDVDLARLFEPFYFRTSGLGRLALPVARRVFESHGGSLTASPGPEGGMRINFMLPAILTYPLPSAGRP